MSTKRISRTPKSVPDVPQRGRITMRRSLREPAPAPKPKTVIYMNGVPLNKITSALSLLETAFDGSDCEIAEFIEILRGEVIAYRKEAKFREKS